MASDRHGPLLVGSVVDGERSRLVAWQMVKGRWRERLIARSGDGGVASWNGSLVLRHDPSGFTLWTPTGDRIFRFDSVDGGRWRRALAYRGAAWSLTGARAGARGREVLMWRGGQRDDRSEVMIGTFPAGR